MSTPEAVYASRYGTRDELLRELGDVLGVGRVDSVGVAKHSGPEASWPISVDGKPWRLPRSVLDGGLDLDRWRRQVAADPTLSPLKDERGLAKSILHRLVAWA